MGRVARVAVGGEIYHVINRAAARLQIFNVPSDYQLFLSLLQEAKDKNNIDIYSYVLMPNHWHLQVRPENDGDLARFMHGLTNAHTRKIHTLTKTIGYGPLYQGRYKSFLVESDSYLLTVLKYIERNPVRAKLVTKAEDWKWGSSWIRIHGNKEQKKLLSDTPAPLPKNYEAWVNTEDSPGDLESMRASTNKGTPFGRKTWIEQMVESYNLGATMRDPGRPTKK